MKKATALLCIILMILSLAGCSGGKPDETSDAMYQIGLNALQTADDYIGGKITGDEASEKLDEYKKQAEAQVEEDCKKLGVDSLIGTDSELSNDDFISMDIFNLSYYVFSSARGTAAMSEVQEKRDNLAKNLGK